MTIDVGFAPDELPTSRIAAQPTMRAAAGAVEMLIYGAIGWDVTAQGVAQALRDLPSNAKLTVRINSGGGSAFDGVAMLSLLSARKPKVIVDGLAASAASLVMLAGEEVQIAQAGFVMIHDPEMDTFGNADEARRAADLLDRVGDEMARLYAARMGIEPDAARRLMRDETWYSADAAVAARLASMTIEAPIVAASVNAGRFSRAPDAARVLFASSRTADAPEVAPSSATQEIPMDLDTTAGATAAAADLPTAAARPGAAPEPKRPAPATVQEIEANLSERTLAALGPAFILAQVRLGATMDQVRNAALDALAAQPDSRPTHPSARMIRDEVDTARARLEGAIEARLTGRSAPADSPAADLRGSTLIDLARESIHMAGGRTKGLSRDAIARAALNLPGAGIRASMTTTSDFPALLSNIQQKRLMSSYMGLDRGFLRFANRRSLPDFKTASIVDLGSAPALQRLAEGGNITYGSMKEAGETYQLIRYAVNVSLSYPAIVNDDLGGFDRMPLAFASSSANLENSIVYGLFNTNATMADGVAWISTATGARTFANTAAGTATPTGEQRILDVSAAMGAMADVTDPTGQRVLINPTVMIVPKAVEGAWRAAMAVTVTPNSPNAANPWAGLFDIVATPFLTDTTDVYLTVAAGTGYEAVEVAYQEDAEAPELTSYVEPDVDGVTFSLRHSFGAKTATARTIRRITY